MFSVPLANPSTLDRREAAARPAHDVLRGGALEPELGGRHRKEQAKADANASVTFHATLRVFLSQAGPRFDLVLLQAGHHLVVPFVSRIALRNEKGDPLGSPSTGSFCG